MHKNPHREYLDILRREIIEKRTRVADLQNQLATEQGLLDELLRLEAPVANLAGVPALGPPELETAHSDDATVAQSEVTHNGRSLETPVRHADVAEVVLREAGRPMRVAEIIKAMGARGHRLPEGPVQQFGAVYSAMLRRPQTFEKIERGQWTLKGHDGGKVAEHDFEAMTQADAAVIALKAIGRPATIAEILDTLEGMGYRHKSDRDHTYNSLYSALKRTAKIRRSGSLGEGLWEPANAEPDRTRDTLEREG